MNVSVELQNRNTVTKIVIKNTLLGAIFFSINIINAILIHTYHKNEDLHTKPRYILFVHLVVNDMLHLFLTVLMAILAHVVYRYNASVCCVLILLVVFTTENTPINLACMALECYVAVCFPLHHSKICTIKRTHLVIGSIWSITVLSGITDLFITLATMPLGFFHTKVICLRNTVFPHPIAVQKRNYSFAILVFVVLFVVVYTYFKIIFTAKAMTKDIKKARNTIILHGVQLLMCVTIYITPELRDTLFKLYPNDVADIQFSLYVTVQVLPRSLSPIIYGIGDKTFRSYMKKSMVCKVENKI